MDCPGPIVALIDVMRPLADRRRAGHGIARNIRRNPLRLEAQKETQISIGKFQDQSAIVKHAVVAGVRPNMS
jgi:hypothetical protein